ncbi:MAG: hypothetical protein IJD58_03150 [Lachnospiraceae bacterium]|nr:hypothetical protein [Lachnospiraceae bacterium]
MIRFIFSEYIDKMWIHLFIICILTSAMLAGGTFVGELSTKGSMYNAVMDSIDGRSLLLGYNYESEMIDRLKDYGKVISNEVYFAVDKSQEESERRKIIRIKACPDEIMGYVHPRLDVGEDIENCGVDENTIAVYISYNNIGIDIGDTIVLSIDMGDGVNKKDVKFYIAGVLSEGQKLYGFDGASRDMIYTDLFRTYSYAQLGEILIITTQKEMEKLEGNIYHEYDSGILTFDEKLTDTEVNNIKKEIVEYERERNNGISFIENVFPTMDNFISDSKDMFYIELKKYIPMIVTICTISLVCMVGIISIKTDMSLKSYTIFRLLGMKGRNIILCNGIEMLINIICALILFVSMATVQNVYGIVDKINLRIDMVTLISVCVFGVLVVVSNIIVSAIILRNNTPVHILKKRI